ncbi:hypothetical protein FGO68_gene5763 [Halteria grandinella]|uniref:Uncharacterized protein n=1 Tax=Halteria grandinella TaxID=5974 RepID=A0A8J8NQE6_HALGN|nr:hypothetical protein FGO68_gene5763 [Halteria grandinella]
MIKIPEDEIEKASMRVPCSLDISQIDQLGYSNPELFDPNKKKSKPYIQETARTSIKSNTPFKLKLGLVSQSSSHILNEDGYPITSSRLSRDQIESMMQSYRESKNLTPRQQASISNQNSLVNLHIRASLPSLNRARQSMPNLKNTSSQASLVNYQHPIELFRKKRIEELNRSNTSKVDKSIDEIPAFMRGDNSMLGKSDSSSIIDPQKVAQLHKMRIQLYGVVEKCQKHEKAKKFMGLKGKILRHYNIFQKGEDRAEREIEKIQNSILMMSGEQKQATLDLNEELSQ